MIQLLGINFMTMKNTTQNLLLSTVSVYLWKVMAFILKVTNKSRTSTRKRKIHLPIMPL